MRYIVLRDLRRTRVADPFGGGRRDFALLLADVSPPEPRIDLEELDRAARNEIVRDPAVVAVTRPMPIRLIEPLPPDEDTSAVAAAPSWGIAAVGADRSRWEFARTAGLPPRAVSVVARTLGTARTDGFAPATDIADRGVGMVTAPP